MDFRLFIDRNGNSMVTEIEGIKESEILQIGISSIFICEHVYLGTCVVRLLLLRCVKNGCVIYG